MASAYKKFLDRNNPPPVSITGKGGKGKEKCWFNMPGNKQKARWPPPKTEETNYDLLMLSHPDIVNRDDETYVLLGPANLKVRVTKENWSTLRLNTKSMSPEYFPSSYLDPIPTVVWETGDASTANFPRSTINETLEDFRVLLLAPVLSKKSKISQDTYWALSLDSASGATHHTDKATAPKRILALLQLCAEFIPCEHEEYEEAVKDLDSEVDPVVGKARIVLEIVQEQNLPAIVKAQNEAVSIFLQALYSLQQGHVQFLIGDYKAHVIDAHGSNAFIRGTKARKLGKDGLPRAVHDVSVSTPSPGQIVGMSQNDEDGALDSDDACSGIHYNIGGERDQANTHVSSTPQQEEHHLSRKRRCLLKTPKRLASALTPRHALSRATMKSWGEPKQSRSTSFRERIGFSEPPERRG